MPETDHASFKTRHFIVYSMSHGKAHVKTYTLISASDCNTCIYMPDMSRSAVYACLQLVLRLLVPAQLHACQISTTTAASLLFIK